MFKRIVTILKQLMGYQSTQASVPVETTASKSVKQPRAKSGQQSLGAQAQSKPAKSKPKRKPSAAHKTTAAASRKPAQKPAQKTSGQRGRPRKTPA